MPHHMATQMFGYSEWSKTRISTPEATTTSAVAVTITPAASLTDGGSRRNFVMRRSIGFGGFTFRTTRARPEVLTDPQLPTRDWLSSSKRYEGGRTLRGADGLSDQLLVEEAADRARRIEP